LQKDILLFAMCYTDLNAKRKQKIMDKLIEFYGSQVAASKALGLSQPYISQCVSRTRYMSSKKAYLAVKLTKGYVSIQQLRPKDFEA
jgi:DNA-binding transcriptional regulator YdaS (Cro superfamily)